ncbi:MAG: TetR/AcrR family transcriptional regulator [Pyrinomonadaceae bacterium]|nr:TetR/AcrR family transcriptional regulator [Pyrinomonadaceae bacterium]
MKDSTRTRTSREAILDATDRLLARYGYKKMTIEDLANEVGIGKGSVYLHFSSKEEIALSHIDRIIERLKTRLVGISNESGDSVTKLRRMMIDRVMYRFESVQHYTQSLNELLARLRAKLLDRRRRYFEEEAKIFARVIEEGKKSGEFECKDPMETARSIIDATNALLPYSLSVHELGERSEVENKITRIADLLLLGIVSRKQ